MTASRRTPRCAFTLIEAVASLVITVTAGSAVLLGIATSVATTNEMLMRTQAAGMAEQLMDEISGQLYCQNPAQPFQYPLGPAGQARQNFDDLGDYAGHAAQPPADRFGVPLASGNGQGGLRDPNFRAAGAFARWRRGVSVTYADPSNLAQSLPAGQTSGFRAVEVTVEYNDVHGVTQQLAHVRRVFSHVPIQ